MENTTTSEALKVPRGTATVGFLTRGELLEMSGLTDSEFRTLTARKKIQATARTAGNWALYTMADVEKAKALKLGLENERRRTLKEQKGFTHKQSLQVFKMLDEGKSLKDIFYAMEDIPVPALHEIVKQYQALTASLFVSPTVMQEIAALDLEGDYPIKTGVQLLEIIKNALKTSHCSQCRKKPRSWCDGCVAKATKAAKASAETTANVMSAPPSRSSASAAHTHDPRASAPPRAGASSRSR